VEREREVVLTSVAVYFDQNRDVRHNFREGVMYSHGSAAKHRNRSSPAVASVVTADGRQDVDLWEVGEEVYVRIVADGQLVAWLGGGEVYEEELEGLACFCAFGSAYFQ
jgi:hypothetical protein